MSALDAAVRLASSCASICLHCVQRRRHRRRTHLPTAAKRFEVPATVLISNWKNLPWRVAAVGLAAVALNAVAAASAHAQTTTTLTTLTVSVAASLQNAMRDIGRAYEARHAGTRVHFNAAASGALLAQIAQGAPVDVLAAADSDTMDRAQAQGLIAAATRVDVAANALVLVSPRVALRASTSAAHADQSPAPPIESLADLAAPAVQRIAIGTPSSVPAGRYAQAAFEAQGVWPALRGKLVFADSVRQVLNYVARGEVDAGVVYLTDALIAPDAVRIDLTLPTAAPVVYPIAVVAASRHAAAAANFVRFVAAPSAQAVLARYGFAPARPLQRAP